MWNYRVVRRRNTWIDPVDNKERVEYSYARGGLNIQAQPHQWCITLNSAHDQPYYFRYPMGLNGIVLPVLIPMTADLKSILAEVEKAI